MKSLASHYLQKPSHKSFSTITESKEGEQSHVGTHQRHNADKESPFLLYIGLKVFSATRSSEIIDIVHAHGLCVSYDRILLITQGLEKFYYSSFMTTMQSFLGYFGQGYSR